MTAMPGQTNDQHRDQQMPTLGDIGIAKLFWLGIGIVVFFFVGLGSWAGFVPLSSAAIAPGVVTVDSRRKTVQHLEGGIIARINVQDGDQVRAGDVLVVLDNAQARAQVNLLSGRLAGLHLSRARLTAERDGATAPDFPDTVFDLVPDGEQLARMMAGEETIFTERQSFLKGQTDINRQRIAQLRAEIAGLRDQIAAENRQLELISQEETGLTDLVEKGLARKPRLLELQREQASIRGSRARNQAAIARAEQSIREAELTVIDARTRFLNEVVATLQQQQAEIADLSEQLAAANDTLSRNRIIAPVAGTVVNTQIFTTGGVIAPAQPILDIVPADDRMLIEAQVAPNDIDVVRAGLSAEVRISVFKQAEAPTLDGVVQTVSADALTDQVTGMPYYLARILIHDLSELPRDAELHPGMPAEVMIITGEQTAIEYLTEPIRLSLRRAMKEY